MTKEQLKIYRDKISPSRTFAVRVLLTLCFLALLILVWSQVIGAKEARKFPGLKTDTSKSIIDLSQVRSGGPGKDGIPALDKPRFIDIQSAQLPDDANGVLVEIQGDQRFYPFSILVWHEIVNDTVGGRDIAVTFCPLCGSAIVFDRRVGKKTLRFGVSGLLFESNLLMYDQGSESLWSQARGQAVVGKHAEMNLKIVHSQLLHFSQLRDHYPKARVMSTKTGYRRDYGRYPYVGYEESDKLYFPVSVQDARFPKKMMFFIVPVGEKSAAFPLDSLREKGLAEISVMGKNLKVTAKDYRLMAYYDGAEVPGYYEMWFSWAIHHQENGQVWKP